MLRRTHDILHGLPRVVGAAASVLTPPSTFSSPDAPGRSPPGASTIIAPTVEGESTLTTTLTTTTTTERNVDRNHIAMPTLRQVCAVEALARCAYAVRLERSTPLPIPKEVAQRTSLVNNAKSSAATRRRVGNALSAMAAASPASATAASNTAASSNTANRSNNNKLASSTSSSNMATTNSPPPEFSTSSVWPEGLERFIQTRIRVLNSIHRAHHEGVYRNSKRGWYEFRSSTIYQHHPPSLFSDEAAVVKTFGMGQFASPGVAGFTAIFRQSWRDFHVTEMEREGVALTRRHDFTIPPLPDSVIGGGREERVEPNDLEGGLKSTRDEEGQSGREIDFFKVDIDAQLRANHYTKTTPTVITDRADDASNTTTHTNTSTGPPSQHHQELYVQCYLHKQHLAHQTALSLIAQHLRLHPSSISVAGIKDLQGDTIQRIRVRGTSPESLREINRAMSERKAAGKMKPADATLRLSHFSYAYQPLRAGHLYGNHFKIVLRDVEGATKEQIAEAMTGFAQRGFPNYFGCQRFSWFGGTEDVAFALLHHNWLVFAFRLLNYTTRDLTLRQLLQRRKKYPLPLQDAYRRNVVRHLRRHKIQPTDLDQSLFTSKPSLHHSFASSGDRTSDGLNAKQSIIIAALREAFFDLDFESRRLTAQRLVSFFWNQALSLRLHYFGSEEVLVGDFVIPKVIRTAVLEGNADREQQRTTSTMMSSTTSSRGDSSSSKKQHVGSTVHRNIMMDAEREGMSPVKFLAEVTAENKHLYTIQDVVHPGFQFEGSPLPKNDIGVFYRQICEKYRVDWDFRHTRRGGSDMRDFIDPPRPIIQKPHDLTYDYNESARVLTVEFSLERGSYANVAMSELLKATQCLGSDKIIRTPTQSTFWDLGDVDRGYVETFKDMYVPGGEEDDVTLTVDGKDAETSYESSSSSTLAPDQNLMEWFEDIKAQNGGQEPTLHLDEDPFKKVARWSAKHLLRNGERRQQDAELFKHRLFERSLAKTISDDELEQYAGHHVPMGPGASHGKMKRVFFKVRKREGRFSGAPKFVPRLKRGAQKQNANAKRASFSTLSADTWNVQW